jgi:hypothetical protein
MDITDDIFVQGNEDVYYYLGYEPKMSLHGETTPRFFAYTPLDTSIASILNTIVHALIEKIQEIDSHKEPVSTRLPINIVS